MQQTRREVLATSAVTITAGVAGCNVLNSGTEEPTGSATPDADHVVDMQAISFDPVELTVSQGDTVAWKHAAGEPHSVTAYQDHIPSGATYWASGEFESEDAARTGWERGDGAVPSDDPYVRTFETPGTHEYFCIPHEGAGMTGSVIVE